MKILALLFSVGLFSLILVFIVRYFDNNYECVAWRTVVSVEAIPLANIWGKEVTYLIKYDDGHMFESHYPEDIGSKECTKEIPKK